jgi:hypothetical protein
MPPFNSAILKLEWAQRHLDFLYSDMRAFYGNQNKPAPRDDDLETQAELVHAPFRPPPVVPWSLIVGDAVHNMRCALDHIAYELAIADLRHRKLNRKPTRDTLFPIFVTPNKGNFERLTADITRPDIRQQIDALQPYDRRNPLWMLAELSNVDKHERLNIFPAVISFTGTLNASSATQIGLADGRVFTVDPATGQPHEELKPSFTPSVSLKMVMPRTAGAEFDVSILQEVHDFISGEVFPQLSRFLTTVPKPPPVT